MRLWVAAVVVVMLLGFLGALVYYWQHQPVAQSGQCQGGECPSEIHESDSGTAFYYPVTGRFTVILNQNNNPAENLRCTPDGIIGPISNIPSVAPPLYAARFEGLQPGTCTLTDDNFSITVIIKQQ
jgi:hypothetical protein